MVKIDNLEVRFDVDGEGDEQVFTELFNKYIQEWGRRQDEQQKLQRRMNTDRQLGDRMNMGDY